MKKIEPRIGIFRGTFDPVHIGHIAFALAAKHAANLDKVYFLPEQNPLQKTIVTDYKTRIKLLSDALKKYDELDVIELENFQGSIKLVIPRLREIFKDSKLVFLMGSDVAITVPGWPDLGSLTQDNELVIGLRNKDQKTTLDEILLALTPKPDALKIIEAPYPDVSSTLIHNNRNQKK